MKGTQIAAYGVLGVWGVAMMRSIVDAGFVVSGGILPVALFAATYLFSKPAIDQLRKGRDESS